MAKHYSSLRSNTFREEANSVEDLSPAAQEENPKSKKTKKEKPKKERPPKKEKPPKQKKELTKEQLERKERRLRVWGLAFLLLGVYLLLSFASYLQTWKTDFSYTDTVFKHFSIEAFRAGDLKCENWMGKTGALISYLFISNWFGIASFLFTIILLVWGTRWLIKFTILQPWKVMEYCFFGIIWLPVFLGLILSPDRIMTGVLFTGVYGFQMNLWLTDFLGTTGLAIVLAFTFLSFMILTFNFPFRWMKKESQKAESIEEMTADVVVPEPGITPAADPEPTYSNLFKDEPREEIQEIDLGGPQTDQNPGPVSKGIELQIEQNAEEEKGEIKGPIPRQGLDTPYDPTLDLPNYKFPTLDLLNDYGGEFIAVRKEELEANKDKIVTTLSHYDIKIAKIKATIGPAVTLYEIVPEAGVRISRIKNLEDDIALSLSALGIRIIAPIPGKGTIGIEVPNQNPEIVSIKSLLGSEKFKNTSFELPFVLGKTVSNETFIADLAKMPHLLMAGATGQGKSVGLNTIITSLLYKKHPSQIKFVMIDPKKVELTLFSRIERHFLAKLPDSEEAIITDTKKVIRTLNSLNIEMDSRYDLLRDAQVRNIKEYNEKFFSRKLNPNDGHKFLPYIVLVIDEFADLIMTAGREIETPLTRLAQLARATGIHLIIATQRPSVNIITGTIKANFPARIAFRVISKIDSRTILDSSGADQLIGRGDMLLSTGSDLIRLQCAFVDTPEIEKLTDYIGSQRGYPQAFSLPEYYDEDNGSGKEFDPNERDEFFTEAARLVVQHQHGSTSLLQRKLKLGYNRAGRIIDQLEAAGIVGSFEGSKAREVRFKDSTSLETYLEGMDKQ
ncbi:MAG: DNA translocase FtsK [Bacteroidetes bacterium]|nr:DNA translocase FtsK [Bacteroidota bacterium]